MRGGVRVRACTPPHAGAALPSPPLAAGNAPTMLTWGDMQKVMPMFFNMSIAVHNDPAASKEWGWVQVRWGCWGLCW